MQNVYLDDSEYDGFVVDAEIFGDELLAGLRQLHAGKAHFQQTNL